MLFACTARASGLDWGTVPQWLTAGVAAVVGLFTIIGVLTARNAYRKSVEDAHLSQARLVWAQVGAHVGKSAGASAGNMGRAVLGSDAVRIIGDSPAFYESKEENGRPVPVMAKDATVFLVRITNNSSEPIGRCRISLSGTHPMHLDAEGKPIRRDGPRSWEHRASEDAARVMPPGETRTLRFVVPITIRDINKRQTYVTLTFADSVGNRWSRKETNRPTAVVPPKKKKFLKTRARWFRLKKRVGGALPSRPKRGA